jgi:hypothetical protein
MKIKTGLYFLAFILMLSAIQGCATNCCKVGTKTISIYTEDNIPANTGISTGTYTSVDGYRYVNIVVEFEQKTANEEPVSLGVTFAHGQNGKMGSRR